jgi:hypothetical protein
VLGGQLDGEKTGSRFDENIAVYFGEDYVESLHCSVVIGHQHCMFCRTEENCEDLGGPLSLPDARRLKFM